MSAHRFLSTAAPVLIIALAGMGLATAQSSSPFASKKKKQAWEQPVQQPVPTRAPQPRPATTYPGQPTYSPPSYAAPSYSQPVQTAPITQTGGSPVPPSGSDYQYRAPAPTPAPAQDWGSPTPPSAYPAAQPSYQAPTYGAPATTAPSRSPYAAPRQSQDYQAPTYQTPGYQNPSYPAPNYQVQPYPPQSGPYSAPPQTGPGGYPAPPAKRSWADKLGLRNIATLFRGKGTVGAAAIYRDQPPNQAFGPEDGWSEDFVADGELEFEVSAITDGGLEYGVALGLRGQYDPYRRGFGGRLPDCMASVAGCSTLRGHTSGFYAIGEDTAKDAQVQLETAHLFLRSAYGDVTVGRDDGAAYLFSLGAPTLLGVGASNSPVDYTGYDSVKTVNDASGFAEKITYTSPRLLGDRIGVGVQIGGSYTPNADACGVDYCVDRDIAGIIRPEIEDVLEAGLALDRTFANGLKIEATGTYARGTETSGAVGLDNLESYGAGLELAYGNVVLGGSWLQSNNGLLDGDYTAYDAGVTWKPGALGFTLSYGHAEDDNVGLTSDQAIFGISYDIRKNFTLGLGAQYIEREVDGSVGGILVPLDQKASSVFIQGGFKF